MHLNKKNVTLLIICNYLPFIIILLFSLQNSWAQNLVPNGDFEEYNTCPSNNYQITNAEPWNSVTKIGLSSTYYNACAPSLVSTPCNINGCEPPHSGDGYASIYTYNKNVPTHWNDNNLYQYIEAPLTHALEKGVRYYVCFFVSLADISNFIVPKLGAYLSAGSLFDEMSSSRYENTILSQYKPQIESTDLFPDTTGWYQISGSFIASGGEDHIVIGCFNAGGVKMKEELGDKENGRNGYGSAAYYVDDVSVSLIETCISSLDSADSTNDGNDTTFTNIEESMSTMPIDFELYPNPFDDYLTIKSQYRMKYIQITDLTGKTLYSESFNSKKISISKIESLASGCYIISILTENGMLYRKVVKE